MLRSSCANATGDFGAVGAVGGPFSPHSTAAIPQVLLEACCDRSSGTARVSIVGGKTYGGSVYYRDSLGNVYLAYSQMIMDTSALQIGPLGSTIEGKYSATLQGAGLEGGPTISGSFRVCHLEDVVLARTQ